MKIKEEQNTKEKIKLLAAQRHLYSQAKGIQLVRLIGTIIVAAISPIIYYIIPESRNILAIIGGVWILLSQIILKRIESKKVKRAAKIQEQFDVELFELPWNKALAGERISPEIINSSSNNFKGNRRKLINWYADTGNLPYPFDVILCQRSNIVWDWRLRRTYAWIIICITSFLFLSEVIVAYATNISFADYILALLIPSISALLDGEEVASEQLRIADAKEKLEKQIMFYWNQGLGRTQSLTRDMCREIQNCIYSFRKEKSLVPDKLYNLLRNQFDSDMKSSVNEMKTKAEKRFEANN